MIIPSNEFIEIFKKTNGALSVCESIAIMNLAAQAPNGVYIELGTHMGKSAMSAAATLKTGIFDLVDPCFSPNHPEWFGDNAVAELHQKLLAANSKLLYLFFDNYSTNILQRDQMYAYVFVDSGSHQDGLPMQEVKLLEDKVIQGGIVAFHDYKSQFTEVEIAYDYLVRTGKYDEIKINWQEIVNFVKQNDLEKGNVSWHHNELEFPCFVGALIKK